MKYCYIIAWTFKIIYCTIPHEYVNTLREMCEKILWYVFFSWFLHYIACIYYIITYNFQCIHICIYLLYRYSYHNIHIIPYTTIYPLSLMFKYTEKKIIFSEVVIDCDNENSMLLFCKMYIMEVRFSVAIFVDI